MPKKLTNGAFQDRQPDDETTGMSRTGYTLQPERLFFQRTRRNFSGKYKVKDLLQRKENTSVRLKDPVFIQYTAKIISPSVILLLRRGENDNEFRSGKALHGAPRWKFGERFFRIQGHDRDVIWLKFGEALQYRSDFAAVEERRARETFSGLDQHEAAARDRESEPFGLGEDRREGVLS